MRLSRLTVITGLLVLGTTLLAADPKVQPTDGQENQAIDNPKQLAFESNTTFQVLDHAIDLWHDAVLKGDDRKASFQFDEINEILFEDIQTDKLQMKMLVRQIEQFYQENSRDGKNVLKEKIESEEIVRYKQFLPLLSSDICVKDELYRAINRTDAFSNKYRLLGDYKNLLRRELGLPKLKMVEIPKEEKKQASTEQ